jgi:hypothetical protein
MEAIDSASCSVIEESGCDDTEMLSHLRERGPHTRGCWAVDLILHSR